MENRAELWRTQKRKREGDVKRVFLAEVACHLRSQASWKLQALAGSKRALFAAVFSSTGGIVGEAPTSLGEAPTSVGEALTDFRGRGSDFRGRIPD